MGLAQPLVQALTRPWGFGVEADAHKKPYGYPLFESQKLAHGESQSNGNPPLTTAILPLNRQN